MSSVAPRTRLWWDNNRKADSAHVGQKVQNTCQYDQAEFDRKRKEHGLTELSTSVVCAGVKALCLSKADTVQ